MSLPPLHSPAHLTRTRSHNSIYSALNRPFHAKERGRGTLMRAADGALAPFLLDPFRIIDTETELPSLTRSRSRETRLGIMNTNRRSLSPSRLSQIDYATLASERAKEQIRVKTKAKADDDGRWKEKEKRRRRRNHLSSCPEETMRRSLALILLHFLHSRRRGRRQPKARERK